MTTYDTARLAPGLRLLDWAYGDWPERIDLDALDMASWTRCIGGQLDGSYPAFALRYGLAIEPELAAAFNADHPTEAPLLTAAWRAEIRRRRAERVSLDPGLLGF